MTDIKEQRLPPLPPEEWDDFLQRLVDAGPGGRDRPLNIFTTLGRDPKLFRRWIGFGDALLNGHLPARSRELVILRVAHLTGSDYEWAQHAPIATAAGVTIDEIGALGRALDRHPWSDEDKALLKVADELDFFGFLEDETFNEAHAILGDEGVIELLMLVGQYQMIAMLLRALRVRLEDG